jgi:hypothetical protein
VGGGEFDKRKDIMDEVNGKEVKDGERIGTSFNRGAKRERDHLNKQCTL